MPSFILTGGLNLGTEHGARLLLWGLLLGVGIFSCLPVLTGAPCASDDNCPSSQHCTRGRCEAGPSTGDDEGEAVRTAAHELRCDDGLDDDADGLSDCADPDCEGVLCRPGAGGCDVAEHCVAGACPPDVFATDGTECRAAVGDCDLEERCTGGPRCPADVSRCAAGEYCDPTGCKAQGALSARCTADAQCVSGHCVEGVCCDTRCEGACERCGSGTCTVSDAGVPGNPSCAPYVCNGSSPGCPQTPTCTSAADCNSGFCVDGYCCDSACSGACDVCNSPAALGRCIPARAGDPGTPSCAPYVCGGSSPVCLTGCTTDLQCATGLYCGSNRTCVPQLDNGTSCSGSGQCLSGHCVDGSCCSSACDQACDSCSGGTCVAMPAASPGAPSCAPFVCDGASASCPGTCDSDSDCAQGYGCNGGSCGVPRANGMACTSAAQCASHQCVDGFCCNTECASACDVCNATPGTCTPAPMGTPGRPSCSGFLCNGAQVSCPARCAAQSDCANGYNCTAGACVSNGGNGAACTNASQCTSGNCVSNVCCNSSCAGACDSCESGTCTPSPAGTAGSPSCAAFVCNGSSTSCPSSCASDAGCADGFSCQAGRCLARLGNGTSCSSPSQCDSGRCVDGVCCNSACTGACNACNVSGSVGTCIATTGPGSPSCAPYLCNGTSAGCPLSCASDANCTAAQYCASTGACRPRRGDGETCSGANQCTSGHCVEGVCCDSGCGGACDTCGGGRCHLRAAGSAGVPSCAPYVCDGTHASCPTNCTSSADCPPGSGCTAGTCAPQLTLGSACSNASQCASANCVDGVCCNTACAGACVSCALTGNVGTCTNRPAGADPENGCGPTTCDGAGVCTAGCGMPGSCPPACGANSFCTSNSTCGPRLADGQACSDRCQCASDHCTAFFADGDGDGFGRAGSTEQRCGEIPPPGFATRGTDCVDTDGQVHPGATELPGDEVDSDCNGEELCYRDDDGDGFRGENTIVSRNLSCADAHEARASTPSGDCCDADGDVHPGQTAYFERGRDRGCQGPRYDYDCDGQETRQWTLGSDGSPACTGTGGASCVETAGLGWRAAVPDCGHHADFAQCTVSDEACTTSVSRRTQTCR